MRGRQTIVGFVAGVVVAMGMTTLFSGNHASTKALAQAEAGNAHGVQRYQISAWAHPAFFSTNTGGSAASHGAYILDTQTGNLWRVEKSQQPERLGVIH